MMSVACQLPQARDRRALPGGGAALCWALVIALGTAAAWADEPQQAGTTTIRVYNVPIVREADSRLGVTTQPAPGSQGFTDGEWSIRVEPSPDPLQTVPWRVIYESLEDAGLRPGGSFRPPLLAKTVPVIEVPEELWGGWMGEGFHDVLGVLFAELYTPPDVNILFSAHPQVDDSGTPVSPTRSRLEATLLTPMVFSLDLAIAIRHADDPPHNAYRLEHEQGHAEHTLQDLVNTLLGPQDWDLAEGKGRRCELTFRWRDKLIRRTWKEYRGGEEPLQTRRVYVIVLPPTRWSQLFDKPAEDITQDDHVAFNEHLIKLQSRFRANWERSRLLFHEQHGAGEQEPRPPSFSQQLRP
jgi:hypothetical protein